MRIERVFTTVGSSPYDGIGFRTATSEIRNPDGSVVFRLDESRCPARGRRSRSTSWRRSTSARPASRPGWSRSTSRACPPGCGAGAPIRPRSRRCPRPSASAARPRAKQVFDRLAGTWTYWGWKGGYFDSEADARAFYDELRFMLASQMAAPNSPQWFNTGLHWAYGIDGPGAGPLLRRRPDRRG